MHKNDSGMTKDEEEKRMRIALGLLKADSDPPTSVPQRVPGSGGRLILNALPGGIGPQPESRFLAPQTGLFPQSPSPKNRIYELEQQVLFHINRASSLQNLLEGARQENLNLKTRLAHAELELEELRRQVAKLSPAPANPVKVPRTYTKRVASIIVEPSPPVVKRGRGRPRKIQTAHVEEPQPVEWWKSKKN
jgi:hypothetical protein